MKRNVSKIKKSSTQYLFYETYTHLVAFHLDLGYLLIKTRSPDDVIRLLKAQRFCLSECDSPPTGYYAKDKVSVRIDHALMMMECLAPYWDDIQLDEDDNGTLIVYLRSQELFNKLMILGNLLDIKRISQPVNLEVENWLISHPSCRLIRRNSGYAQYQYRVYFRSLRHDYEMFSSWAEGMKDRVQFKRSPKTTAGAFYVKTVADLTAAMMVIGEKIYKITPLIIEDELVEPIPLPWTIGENFSSH